MISEFFCSPHYHQFEKHVIEQNLKNILFVPALERYYMSKCWLIYSLTILQSYLFGMYCTVSVKGRSNIIGINPYWERDKTPISSGSSGSECGNTPFSLEWAVIEKGIKLRYHRGPPVGSARILRSHRKHPLKSTGILLRYPSLLVRRQPWRVTGCPQNLVTVYVLYWFSILMYVHICKAARPNKILSASGILSQCTLNNSKLNC